MVAVPSQGSERQERKAIVAELLRAALRAVEPAEAMHRVLRRRGERLLVAGHTFELNRYRRIFVLGAGKAAAAMASAAEQTLGDRLTAGVVAIKAGYSAPTTKIKVAVAGHPIPDAGSVALAQEIAALARDADQDDLIIFILSGGASALLALPAAGLDLDDKRRVTESLLRAGATINELNAVRKHLSAIKGGNLARLSSPATVLSFILSDVVGSPLEVIASGPTVADSSTYADAYGVLAKYELLQVVPATVLKRLRDGVAGGLPETPKPGDPALDKVLSVVIGSNEIAAEAALHASLARGHHAMLLSTFIQGEAREVGRVFAGLGKEMAHSGRPVPRPGCVIAGGETTVTVRGHGAGGRNQELALAAAIELAGIENVAIASVASDGTDGPTSAAGAYADGQTARRAAAAGFDMADTLANNDSHALFAAIDDLIVTGPTNTNVNDLMFVLAFP